MAAQRRTRDGAAGIRVHGNERVRRVNGLEHGPARVETLGHCVASVHGTECRAPCGRLAAERSRGRGAWDLELGSWRGFSDEVLCFADLPPRRVGRDLTLVWPATATICADARGDISHRQGERGSGCVDVRGAAQTPAASLVAAAAAGSALGGARGAPHERCGVARGGVPAGFGGDGAGGVAYGLPKLPAGGRASGARSAPGGVAAEEARRVHQAREGARPLRARARTTDEPADDRDERLRKRGVRAGGDDAHAVDVRAPRQAAVQAPRGASVA